MSDIKQVVVIGDGPIKDDAAIHGKDIGYVWGGYGVELSVDYALEHERWVPITNPPTWKDSGKQGWIKVTRIMPIQEDLKKYVITIKEDGSATIDRIG